MLLLGLARVNARDEPNLGAMPVDGQAIKVGIGLLEHSSAAAFGLGNRWVHCPLQQIPSMFAFISMC